MTGWMHERDIAVDCRATDRNLTIWPVIVRRRSTYQHHPLQSIGDEAKRKEQSRRSRAAGAERGGQKGLTKQKVECVASSWGRHRGTAEIAVSDSEEARLIV